MAAVQRTALPWILGAATAQLIVFGAARPAGTAHDVAACALVLVLPLAASLVVPRWWRCLHVTAVVGALGGLGMLAGALVDAPSSGLPACHAAGGGLITWSNGAMLAGCLPACLWLSPGCRSSRPWLGHAACFVGMMLGMHLGGRWLAPLVGATVSETAAPHIAMVLGMMLGAAAGHQAIHDETARDPARPSSLSASVRRRPDRAPVPQGPAAQLRGAGDA